MLTKYKKFILLASLLLVSITLTLSLTQCQTKLRQQAAGNQFYVDSTAGSDTNNGTSEITPWKTLAKLQSQTFSPGDTINLKAGSSWEGGLTFSSSGTAGNPITIKSYGTGNRPAISNSGGEDITVTANYVVLQDILVHDSLRSGVYLKDGASNNIIRNIEGTKVGFGIWINGNKNLITENNMHDLTMVVNTPGGDDDTGAIGYILNKANDNEISYNKCTNCTAPSQDYEHDGGFVETWQDASRNLIHHNRAENTNGFIEVGGDDSKQVVADNKVYYNVVHNTGSILVVQGGNYRYAVNESNMIIENNTFIGSSGIVFNQSAPSPQKLTFRNNIVADGDMGSDGNFTRSNNLYGSQLGYALGPGEKSGNPLFVSAADFRLQQGSPAIDAGTSLGYNLDFDKKTVPSGSAPDIGALEYGSTSTQPSFSQTPSV